MLTLESPLGDIPEGTPKVAFQHVAISIEEHVESLVYGSVEVSHMVKYLDLAFSPD